MKRVLTLLVFGVCFSLVAQDIPIDIRFPGAGGMVVSKDAADLEPHEATLMYNLVNSYIPGALTSRSALWSWGIIPGGDIDSLTSIFGYYNSFGKQKFLVGTTLASATDTTHAHLVRSDTFHTTLIYDAIATLGDSNFVYANLGFSREYDYEKVFDNLIICDGKSVPLLMTPEMSVGDTTERRYNPLRQDSSKFSPMAFTLGYLAPGQLRAVPYDSGSGGVSGYVRYKYCFTENTAGDGNFDSTSFPGIASAPVFLTPNQEVKLTGFEALPQVYTGASASDDAVDTVLLLRQVNGGNWMIRKSVVFDRYDLDFFAIDTSSTADSIAYYGFEPGLTNAGNTSKIREEMVRPGGLLKDTVLSETRGDIYFSAVELLDTTKAYWIAYSYYDPKTGIESPMGYSTKITAAGTNYYKVDYPSANDTTLYTWRKGFTNTKQRAPWIRIWRSLGNDSTIMVGLYEFRANHMTGSASIGGEKELKLNFCPAFINDDTLLAGTQTTEMTIYNYNVSIEGKAFGGPRMMGVWLGVNRVMDWYGDPIARGLTHPYILGCQLVLDDVEFSMNRMWGIGNPEFPQRLYYSEHSEIGEWYPDYHMSLDEDDADELVAIFKAESGQSAALVAFKHNAIYGIVGDDPEHDLSYYPITTEVGALNKRTCVQVGNKIYFLSMRGSAYVMEGLSKPKKISIPVDANLRVFVDTTKFGIHTDGFISWLSVGGQTDYTFDYTSGTWTRFEYGNDKVPVYPLFTAVYDTTSGTGGFDNTSICVVAEVKASTTKQRLFAVDKDARGFDYLNKDTALLHHIYYMSPCFGDGMNNYSIPEIFMDLRNYNLDTLRVATRRDTSSIYGGTTDTIIFNQTTDQGIRRIYSVGMEQPTQPEPCVQISLQAINGAGMLLDSASLESHGAYKHRGMLNIYRIRGTAISHGIRE